MWAVNVSVHIISNKLDRHNQIRMNYRHNAGLKLIFLLLDSNFPSGDFIFIRMNIQEFRLFENDVTGQGTSTPRLLLMTSTLVDIYSLPRITILLKLVGMLLHSCTLFFKVANLNFSGDNFNFHCNQRQLLSMVTILYIFY